MKNMLFTSTAIACIGCIIAAVSWAQGYGGRGLGRGGYGPSAVGLGGGGFGLGGLGYGGEGRGYGRGEGRGLGLGLGGLGRAEAYGGEGRGYGRGRGEGLGLGLGLGRAEGLGLGGRFGRGEIGPAPAQFSGEGRGLGLGLGGYGGMRALAREERGLSPFGGLGLRGFERGPVATPFGGLGYGRQAALEGGLGLGRRGFGLSGAPRAGQLGLGNIDASLARAIAEVVDRAEDRGVPVASIERDVLNGERRGLQEDDSRTPRGPVAVPFSRAGQLPGGFERRRGREFGPVASPFDTGGFGRRRGREFGPIAAPFDEGTGRRRGRGFDLGPAPVDVIGRRGRGYPSMTPLPADFPAFSAVTESPNPDASPVNADYLAQSAIQTRGGGDCYVKIGGVWVQCQMGGQQTSYLQGDIPTRKPVGY